MLILAQIDMESVIQPFLIKQINCFFYQEFGTDFFFFILGRVPEEVAVFSDKLFDFRAIHTPLV